MDFLARLCCVVLSAAVVIHAQHIEAARVPHAVRDVCTPTCTNPAVTLYELPVFISQYFETNTTINLPGGVEINIDVAPTLFISSVTVTETVTPTQSSPSSTIASGVSSESTPFVLSIVGVGATKRQDKSRFLDFNGHITGSCNLQNNALMLQNGQLSSNNMYFSTSGNVEEQIFSASSTVQIIWSGFSISADGTLSWTSAGFQNGAAHFCSTGSDIVAVFVDSVPDGCEDVHLSMTPASACLSTSSSTTSTSSSLSSSSASSSVPSASSLTITSSVLPIPTDAFKIQVVIPAPSNKQRRQAKIFIAQGGVLTADESLAQQFNVVNGQLFSNSGQYSTNINTPLLPFDPITPLGTISRNFIEAGSLIWENGNFTNGEASYCVLDDVVQFVFLDTAPTCEAVQLAVIPVASTKSSIPIVSSTTSFSPTSSAQTISSPMPSSIPSTSTSENLFAEATSVIISGSYQNWCSSFLGYHTPGVTLTASSTEVILSTTTAVDITDFTPLVTSEIPATASETVTTTIFQIVNPPMRKRAPGTPTALTRFPTDVLSSACSAEATSVTVTSTVVFTDVVSETSIVIGGTIILTSTQPASTILETETVSTTTSIATSAITCSPSATVPAGSMATFEMFYSGMGFTDSPNNPGNTNSITMGTGIGSDDCTSAISACASMTRDNNYLSFDVHLVSTSGSFECVMYQGYQSNPQCFNVNNSTILLAFGYVALA